MRKRGVGGCGAEGATGSREAGQGEAGGAALPSDCTASSLCCTCCAIILLMPMRLSVMALDDCARLSLVVFLQVQRAGGYQWRRSGESPPGVPGTTTNFSKPQPVWVWMC